jgi:cobalt-zinc-cadmium efflux system membrane fusion protein
MFKHKNIGLLILPLIALFQSCGNKATQADKKENEIKVQEVVLTDAQMQNASIGFDTAKIVKLSGTIKVNGVIDVPPQNMVSVSLPLGGFLVRTKLLPGMHLNKGDVIAVMEDQQYIQLQQDYLTAKVRFSYIEKEYQRQAELNQSKASSDKVFEQSKSDYQSQKILINALAEKLKLIGLDPSHLNENNMSKSINVYSPINGFVSKVNVNIGRYINPSDVMFELVNPDDIHLNLTIYEKDLQSLHIGSKVKAFTNNNPEKLYDCDVILIGQDVSKEGFVQVHCHFHTYSNILIPGMYMNAELESDSKMALALPESAVVSHEGVEFVFVEKSNKHFEMLAVKTLSRSNGKVEIEENAQLIGAKIVVNGAYDLLMMAKNTAE